MQIFCLAGVVSWGRKSQIGSKLGGNEPKPVLVGQGSNLHSSVISESQVSELVAVPKIYPF